ncbi:MAG: imidazole glycerol phosphate synthase subunit hisF [Fusobacteria bacterium]|nr:MAG: imidazole glycerol phosphate synthase subunit hisF [Fusobacteriota bacterium]KAF0229721.1 MAG: imidazole glycerol phosphate synthase subunit [Fusobacteriota bacterium]
MLKKRIIPCLDVREGRVVKGINFVDITDAGDPVEMAKFYDKEGADELVFLDITASHEKRDTMIEVVRQTAKQVFIPFTVGGGIKTIEDMRNILRAGADKVSINSPAILNKNLITQGAKIFGSQCMVVAIDAKKNDEGIYEAYINGGRINTGLEVISWAKEAEAYGAGEILLTSMDRDGTKDGYDLELTKLVSEAVSIPVIASGGVGNLEHLYDGLVEGKAQAALAASIFHYGTYSIREAKKYLIDKGVDIRW